MSISINWVAEYHGKNPVAAGPVVVAEVKSDAHLDLALVERARQSLWAYSDMTPPDSARDTRNTQDALQAIAETSVYWAQAVLNEIRGYVVHAGTKRIEGRQVLWLGFHHPELSRIALRLAFNMLTRLMAGEEGTSPLKAELERLWKACKQHHPDFQARILMVAAREMDIPFFQLLPGTRYWQFGWGANARVFFETASNQDGALGWLWQKNKVASKDLMRTMGIPTPAHVMVLQEAELMTAVAQIGFPCVIKPIDRGGGKGVTANINDNANLLLAFRQARQFSQAPLMLEKHVQGTDYRLMVIRGKLLAAIARRASYVTGDGIRTVRELVAELNAGRFQNLLKSRYLRPIAVDEVLQQHLAAQGISLDEVLSAGRQVTLRSNANRSTGGICEDVTAMLHPGVRAMAEQFARAAGLETAGLDYLTTDIRQAPEDSGGAFIEINATPGMAVFVAAGWSEAAIGRQVLGEGLKPIPVTLNVWPADSLSRQLKTLRNQTLRDDEAWVCGSELHMGPAKLHCEATQPWSGVQAALRNPHLQKLHIYCSAQEIERSGLPLDRLSQADIQDPQLSELWRHVIQSAIQTKINT